MAPEYLFQDFCLSVQPTLMKITEGGFRVLGIDCDGFWFPENSFRGVSSGARVSFLRFLLISLTDVDENDRCGVFEYQELIAMGFDFRKIRSGVFPMGPSTFFLIFCFLG